VRLDRVFVTLQSREVRGLVLAVATHLDGGLSSSEVDEFCEALDALAPDDDVLIEPIVGYRGEALPLVIDAFKEEAGRCEVGFLVPRALAELVQQQAERVCPAAPVRVLSGGVDAGE